MSNNYNVRDKRTYISKRNILLTLVSLMGMLLCGFIFDSPEMTLDTEKNVVYRNYSIDKVLADFASDEDLAKDDYAKARVAILGKVSEISKNYKDVTLGAISGTQEGAIKCSSSDKDIIAYIKTLSKDDIVKVYGEFTVSFIGGNLGMDISKVEKATTNSASSNLYSLLNGNTVDVENLYTRTLANDKITYYIPAEWSEVEYDIVNNNLGSMEGYQYRLNEISQSPTVQPESLFVCYFDNKLLKNSSDKSKTDLIEKAIIANILNKSADNLEKFPAKRSDTYYGVKYQYYQDAYKDTFGQGHHVEFIFQQVDTDGVIVYLYIYTDANHVDDIILLMRLLEVK